MIIPDKFAVNVEPHQRFFLILYLLNLIMHVLSHEIRDQAPFNMLFADNIIV